jgi:hypothetical protein
LRAVTGRAAKHEAHTIGPEEGGAIMAPQSRQMASSGIGRFLNDEGRLEGRP